MTTVPEKDFYTIEEVAELLRVDSSTIRRWIKEEKITTRRFGRQHRIAFEEVQRILREGV